MIVYLTFSKNCHVATEFFTLLTVEKCDASSLFEVLLNRLHSAAVDVSNIVGASMDGASVMLGKDNGLVARIREHVPHLFSGHYIAHREVLAVKDAVTSNPDLDMVDKVVRTVAVELEKSCVWSQRFKYLQFARNCVDNLIERLDDLRKLGPTKLFRAGKWPKIKAQRERKFREWLHGCSKFFRNKLSGFDLKAAERELPTFRAVMETHHELEFFAQGLTNILGSAASKRYRSARASARSLRLCACHKCFFMFDRCAPPVNRGVREGFLQAKLHQVVEALEVWRSMRRRRPAKSVKLAVVERGRKGKTKEGEDEAGTAGQNEEEEEDVEQELGDDQELVGEEEDNPFLSDDEDVEEVFDFGKPVH
ncbi:unnamed protein product [Closterium sp. NIES-53]